MAAEEKSEKPLTPRQRAFVEAYLGECRFNGVRSAEKAGYKGAYHTLGVTAHDLLKNPKIREIIDTRLSESIMPANEVLTRLARHASASLADVLDDDGEFDLKAAKRKGTDDLLKKLKVRKTVRRRDGEDVVEDVTYEYEIHDPQAALVHLGRYHKLFTDKTELTGSGGGALSIEAEIKIDKIYDGSADTTGADRETGDSGA